MKKRFVTIALVCCLCVAMVGVAVADSESLRAANAIETPEETPVSGTTTNHIGVFEQGENIEATITGPDETYDIGLFDSSDTEIANQTEVTETVHFDSSDLEPGSYLLSVTNTAFEYVSPVVISGYDIDVELTENTADNELTVTGTVTETALEGAPHAVEAVVWNDETQNRIELVSDSEFSSSATYTGTVSLDEFDGDAYQVYVVATSDNEIYQGENEIVAVGEAPENNQGGSDDTDESTGNDETDGESDESDGDESQDELNESDDDDSSVIEPNTSTDNESTPSDNASQTDDDSVDGTTDDETTDETPLSMVVPVVALLLAAVGIARYRNANR